MRELLVTTRLPEARRRIQAMYGPQSDRREDESQQGAEACKHTYFNQMLLEYLPAAGSQSAPDTSN